MSAQPTPDADLLIVGGGMSGLAAALACAEAGLQSVVVDAAAPPSAGEADIAADPRASAIAYANMRMLDVLGAGARLRDHAGRMDKILVTDGRAPDRAGLPGAGPAGPSGAFLGFDARDIAAQTRGEPLAFMLENVRLRQVLGELAAAAPLVRLIAPAEVVAVTFDGPAAQAQLRSGETLCAPLAVGAEARAAVVRRAMGVRVHGWRYGQHGVVTTVRMARDHDNTAHEFFLPAGPFAILPLPERRASLVWTERAAAAEAAVALPDAAFAAEVRRRFGDFLGAVEVAGPRLSFPLGLSMAERFVAPRAALLGDAARAVHPLAGQGFNLALKDAAALAEVLGEARRVGEDLGAPTVLERYEQWRRFDSASMALATDALNRLFSNDLGPLRALRGWGLQAVNALGVARGFFAREAGADWGDTPKLLRGERLG